MILKQTNNYLFFFFITSFLVFTLPACVLDDTSPNPVTQHGFTSFEAIFKAGGHDLQIVTGNANQDIVFTGDGGTNVTIPAGSLETSAGNPVGGAVEIQLIEAVKKSDWVMGNRPLINSAGILLEAASGYFLEVWKDEQLLRFKNEVTFLFDAGSEGPDDDLDVYYDSNDNNAWEVASDNSAVTVENISGGEVYKMTASQMGWMASCRPLEAGQNTTSVTVTTNKDNDDMLDQKVYLLFDDFSGMAILPINGTAFSATGITVGATATLVGMAFDEYEFYFNYADVTITENLEAHIDLRNFSREDFFSSIRSID